MNSLAHQVFAFLLSPSVPSNSFDSDHGHAQIFHEIQTVSETWLFQYKWPKTKRFLCLQYTVKYPFLSHKYSTKNFHMLKNGGNIWAFLHR